MSTASSFASDSAGSSAGPPARSAFVTTHWSVVAAAGGNETTAARAALERLCETYWYPLYVYVRRRGYSPEDAQDLTQAFFAEWLAHNWVAGADRSRGRFRTFLLTALSRFLANEWDKARARKRGGGARVLSFDTAAAEGRYQAEPASTLLPDRLYDRHWALTLLDQALAQLGADFARAGKAAEFAALSPFLAAERGAIPYGELAARLGWSEPAVRQAVHRLRTQFRAAFRQEILRTVEGPEEVEAEIRHLLAALAE